MILELDCGNSLIKWRAFDPSANTVSTEGVAISLVELLAQLAGLSALRISRARLVSVRSDDETADICLRLAETLGVEVQRAVPAKRLGGVVNGYLEHERLGMDRWLAIVGAFHLSARAMLVIDLGTAVTVDLVDSEGAHLGGYICPGMSLLRHQLQAHTRRIRYDVESARALRGEVRPGRSTGEAVERGCLLMLRSFVESQILQASDYLGDDFVVYATGGDVALIADIANIRCVPDLIFRGLAIACP
ncbi:type III pantothenate kinase [Pseudomonas lopnurensis]|uniref:type III pantothenate kinase n=1 Tax=Pseudomonas lopnurensis TaxID=1477517 RepID=UPI00187A8059|nr:type III pantothenate kinase [Pseudomonas lopnurensis]MBE7374211.1 type III pantothenate kinase [Pseudomonas lopnurensis]